MEITNLELRRHAGEVLGSAATAWCGAENGRVGRTTHASAVPPCWCRALGSLSIGAERRRHRFVGLSGLSGVIRVRALTATLLPARTQFSPSLLPDQPWQVEMRRLERRVVAKRAKP